jgi:asparagine synthase (glutamine-hydrolysing)
MMIVNHDRTIVRPYWQLTFPDHNEVPKHESEPKIIEQLRELLDDATCIRLRANVPVGAYLSGGLDSSVVCALAAGRVPDRLRTFSVTFDTAEHDESQHQNEMVHSLGTHHSSISCHNSDIVKVFPDVVRHMESPVVRTGPAPLHILSKFVRSHGYKVVLTGEGADEIFAGYDIFKEAAVRRFCVRQRESHIRPHLFRKLYPYLPGLRQQSPEYLAAFFGADLNEDDLLFSHRLRFKGTAAAKIFFSDSLREVLRDYDPLSELLHLLPSDYSRWHPLHQAQYIETSFLLPGYILSSQGDRVAMAHGVEGRFPFLDHRLVEFAARVPPSLKPPSINMRTKQPYRAPDSQSFRAPVTPDYVSSALAQDAIASTGLFNPRAVSKLYMKWQSQGLIGFRDNTAFVGILSTQLWHDEFIFRSKVPGHR